MKKVISLLLALAMVASLLCTAAFAEGSKTNLFEVIKAQAEDVELEYEISETEVAEPTDEEAAAAIDAAIAALEESTEEDDSFDQALLERAKSGKLVLVDMRDYAADQYPCDLVFYGEGTENVPVLVMIKYAAEDGAEEPAWELKYANLGGEFSVNVEADGTYAAYTFAD